MLLSLIILGILGGLITGISPCILPILPVILVTGGADSARTASTEFGQTGIAKDSADNVQALFSRRSAVLGNAAPAPMQRTASRWRPYQVVGGLVLSFQPLYPARFGYSCCPALAARYAEDFRYHLPHYCWAEHAYTPVGAPA